MASSEDPTKPFFTEDEDLLDDDDDDDSDDDDSASAPANTAAPPQVVTIAVPGVPDLHLKQPPSQEIVVAKKPAQLDETRKLFQRLWTDEDEIELLQGFLDYTTLRSASGSGTHNPSHHHDTTAFYDQIRSKFQLDFNKNQLVEKLRRLKKKYRNVVTKFGSGKDYAFKSPHDQATFQISSRIWGNTALPPPPPPAINGYDDDVDDPNNPDCQSPNLTTTAAIDINTTKTPRPRKRNRAGPLKTEHQQQFSHTVNNNNISSSNNNNNASNNQPSVPVTPVPGMGFTGSMSTVIEETVKSCLSPIFKELLGNNNMSSNSNTNGGLYGQGFGFALSPLPLGFPAAMGVDRMGDDKWRKQQILELEVFSKRLELVQDQINEQLQELRSMGN